MGDGSLDFGRASSCFQVNTQSVTNAWLQTLVTVLFCCYSKVTSDGDGGDVVSLEEARAMFDYSKRPELKRLLDSYDVIAIEVRFSQLYREGQK